MAFTLRNLEDTDAINDYIDTHNVHKALVVGAGYISLEVLENLYQRGLDITLIHRSEQVNKLMDQDMNQPIFDKLEEKQIEYRLNEEITDINGHEVSFKSGKKNNLISSLKVLVQNLILNLLSHLISKLMTRALYQLMIISKLISIISMH